MFSHLDYDSQRASSVGWCVPVTSRMHAIVRNYRGIYNTSMLHDKLDCPKSTHSKQDAVPSVHSTRFFLFLLFPFSPAHRLPLPGPGVPATLAQPRRLAHLALRARLHPPGAEAAHVGRALGVARLGVPLLAAEAVLLVLLLALAAGLALAVPAAAERLGVVLLDLAVDADVEEVCLGGADVVG